jgi:sugar (pentulose or hexulose) kinase
MSGAAFFGVAYDIRRCRFDDDVLGELELPAEKLPELVDCNEVIGTVDTEVASRLGVQAGCLVAGGQVDCNAAWLGGGAVNPGDFQLNLGTCGVIGVVHDQPEFLRTPAGRQVVNIPYTTDVRRVYSAVAVTMTGGQVLRYLRDLAGAAELSAAASARGLDPYDLLTLQAATVPPGSEGLLALPYFMGERVPLWDSTARAAYVGLSLHHGRGHLVSPMRCAWRSTCCGRGSWRSVNRSSSTKAAPVVRSGDGSSPTCSRSAPRR